MHSYARLSIFGILAIVLLRFVVGYHFYMEGVSKVGAGKFQSEGFLTSAEGPLAGMFHSLIWDYDGKIRLDRDGLKKLLSTAADQCRKHFGLTDKQAQPLHKLCDAFKDRIDAVLAEGAEDIEKYWLNIKRLQSRESDRVWQQVASLNGQIRKISKDSRAQVTDTLAAIEGLWRQYERRLNGIPTREQFQAAGPFRLERPGEGLLTTRLVDRIIPIFDMVIGILLMVGLLTPVASLLGALFLASVVLSQMPGYPGTAPTYFQAVECLALLVLMSTDAGRYAGLDFIPWAWWNRKSKGVAIEPA